MEENWTTVIKPKTGWFEINLKELVQYRDLIILFVKRNFAVQYKQTILGPLWFIINPLITTVMYTLVFGTVAGLSTAGVPQFAFYLCSNALWQYFATCLNQTSNTFTGNAGIFGKVYFPRITMPIATVIYSLVNFFVVFIMSLITNIYYYYKGENIIFGVQLLLIPILVFQTAALGLGFGIIVSSLTTKYRDLVILINFGVQLWMYATPVVYDIDQLPEKFQRIIMLNPMSPVICNFRYAMLGCGSLETHYWGISIVMTVVVLMIGVLLFNRVEKNFMDTV
jgi:lipopolysaccharide transport system permease protein